MVGDDHEATASSYHRERLSQRFLEMIQFIIHEDAQCLKDARIRLRAEALRNDCLENRSQFCGRADRCGLT